MITKIYNHIHNYNKHNQFLIDLPKIIQKTEYFKTLYSPKEFRNTLLYAISTAYSHIYLTTLYLEHDQGGEKIFNTLLQIKKNKPNLVIKILVDWHRAQRCRIGSSTSKKITNVDWYYHILKKNPNTDIRIYGIPINTNEIFGVLHLKGFIIDDQILYSGANLNNEYLHMQNKYRYDRYHFIKNSKLSDIMIYYIEKELLSKKTAKILGKNSFHKSNKNIRSFRKNLKKVYYHYQGNATFQELSITPLVGLGKKSTLNQTIHHLICSTQKNTIVCTPYFNISHNLKKNLIHLLKNGKIVEIIVGDKIANDFYITEDPKKPFILTNIVPYLYELNLRYFLKKTQKYIDKKQLVIRLWKEGWNGFHIKGIWVDDEWQLITGNNLNPRSLRLDLENALLIHDPKQTLLSQKNQELKKIRKNTSVINHHTELQCMSTYPKKIKKIIYKIQKTKFNLIINKIL